MTKKTEVHSGNKKEHQFDMTNKRKFIKEFNESIDREGKSKTAEILWHFIKNHDKKRKKKIKALVIIGFTGIILVIIFTLVFEKIGTKNVLGGVGVGSLFAIIVAIIKQLKIPKETRRRQKGESIAEGIIGWVKYWMHRLMLASGVHIIIGLIVTMVLSFFLAWMEPSKYISIFFSGGTQAVISYNNNNITDSVMVADGGSNRISASNEMKLYLAGEDEVLMKQLDKAEITNEQRTMTLQLSDQDVYNIFGCWEDKLDEDQEQLNGMVLSAVQGWCSEKRDNVFDKAFEQGGAPQKVKDTISRVSEEERPDNSFSVCEEILDIRESIARDYPKRTLMQLIANGYQGMALMLVWHEGVQATVIYNYGQSILFDFECLKFADNTDKTIKERLSIIAQRYEDIVYVCPDYERAGDARKLAAAFRYAANQY